MKKTFLFLSLSIMVLWSTMSLAQSSQNVNLLYHWNDSAIVGSAAFNNAYNEVWGFVYNGREYGVIGSTEGTHIFDVTNPASTVLVDFIPGKVQGPSIIHRDFHDYNNYLYIVADEGPSSLQIADLTYLPDSVHMVYDDDALFVRAHNIFIDTATAKLYVCATFSMQRGYHGLEIYDLTNPLLPVLLKTEDSYGTVHDIYVRNDIAYLNCGNSTGLQVVNYSIATSPILLGSLTNYIYQGYNHSGWLSESGQYYAFADETHGMRIKLADVNDLMNISVVSTFTSGMHPNAIPHNLMIRGNYVYVSYYYDGFQVFNISNPASPFRSGFYDTSPLTAANNSYEGAWGIYSFLPSGNVLISDMQTGFWVLDPTPAVTSVPSIKSSNDIFIYPNPVEDNLNIRFEVERLNETVQVGIYNMAGQLVFELDQFVDGNTMQLTPDLSAGIYTLSIQGIDFLLTEKLNVVSQ